MATHRTLAELLGRGAPARSRPAEPPTPRATHDDAGEPNRPPAAPADQPRALVPRSANQPSEDQPSEDQPSEEPRYDERTYVEPGIHDRAFDDPGAEVTYVDTNVRINTPEPGSVERITLYLHPDDRRALGLAKLDDRIDHNTRIRAMIALWRANPEAVDRVLARHRGS